MPFFHRLTCILALASALPLASAQPAPLRESDHSSIEYPSPGAAYRALRADPGVTFETRDGWVVARDKAKRVVWTFSPKDDPAFPAVVKRAVVERDGQVMVHTGVLCGASKAVCDDFVRKFMRLDDELAREVQRRGVGPASSASAP